MDGSQLRRVNLKLKFGQLQKVSIASGVQLGDRVAIMARTRYEWTILDFAIWFAGGVSVPIYETSSAEQVDWILTDSNAVGIIVETPQLRDTVTPILPSKVKNCWVMTENVLAQLAYLGRDISDQEIDNRRNALNPDTLATLIYTSGTTGKPKGVQLTHGNFLSECGNVVSGAADLFIEAGWFNSSLPSSRARIRTHGANRFNSRRPPSSALQRCNWSTCCRPCIL